MPVMIPIKKKLNGANDVIGFQDFKAGETVGILHGGTGAISSAQARANLGLTQSWVQEQIPDRVTVVANKTIQLTDHTDLQEACDEALRWHSLDGRINIRLPVGQTVVPLNIRCRHPQKIRIIGNNSGGIPPRRANLSNNATADLVVAQGIHDSELVPASTTGTTNTMFDLNNFNNLEIYGVLVNIGTTANYNYAFYRGTSAVPTSLTLTNTTIYGSTYGVYTQTSMLHVSSVTIMHTINRGIYLSYNNSLQGSRLSVLYTVTGIYNLHRSWLLLYHTEVEVTGVVMYAQYGSYNYFLGGYFKGGSVYLMQAYSGVHIIIYTTASNPTTLVGTSFCYAYYDSILSQIGSSDPAYLDVTGLTTYFVRGMYDSLVYLTPAIANQPHLTCRLDYRSTGNGASTAGTTIISPAIGADGNNGSRWY